MFLTINYIPNCDYWENQCRVTLPGPGDEIDNDCDGNIDEEIQDQRDNDGDGLIDEDFKEVGVFWTFGFNASSKD